VRCAKMSEKNARKNRLLSLKKNKSDSFANVVLPENGNHRTFNPLSRDHLSSEEKTGGKSTDSSTKRRNRFRKKEIWAKLTGKWGRGVHLRRNLRHSASCGRHIRGVNRSLQKGGRAESSRKKGKKRTVSMTFSRKKEGALSRQGAPRQVLHRLLPRKREECCAEKLSAVPGILVAESESLLKRQV